MGDEPPAVQTLKATLRLLAYRYRLLTDEVRRHGSLALRRALERVW